VTRVAREVGTEGQLGGQAQVPGVSGTWKDLTDSVNFMASNLTDQVRNIADVTTAVARGDLSRKITVDVKGEILELKNTINVMVDQLNAFASEVTRVAREVGTEGKLGGQAVVPGVAGTWKDLTDNVNSMATNLTNQVRGIAKVVTAVARGELTRKLALEARGEIAELADTINSMTDTLALFAEQVITVAREVGVEGKLGGQAKVPGAAGTWRGLTDNVNQLAANLTTQVRAIGDVATAVTKGDLTRTITVEASGEVAALKDNINEMIRNLKETTQKTTEQDWLKTNLARFSRMMQGQRDLVTVAQQILSELAPLVSAQHGVFYITEGDDDRDTRLKLLASYAASEDVGQVFRLGQGLVGQCAYEKRKILLMDVPSGHVRIRSGLGESGPRSLLILPVLFEGRVNAVIELASFDRFSSIHQVFLDQLTESIGIVVNTIAASMRTEGLLQQSQSLTQELQSQQEELRQTNERLERQAATLRESEERLTLKQDELQQTNEQLEDKAKLLEIKNREVEYAKAEIEEKAEQLALTSKYKSEFLANMSHELRTPLNSLLILSKMLSDNAEGNLTAKQVGFAHTIHGSGTDLLALINDILDLSKIESGTITVEPSDVMLGDLRSYVEQNFRHVAQQKGLEFAVELENGLPPSILTDSKRLQQVLKNLLSNAFKFTEHGAVTMEVRAAGYGWSRDHEILNHADKVVAFSVTDTGIGIPEEKQRIIFEAFQQADGTTSRRYGGTGLGLSISREIARLLGGEIRVVSLRGTGSTFTFYLPRHYVSVPAQPTAPRASELMRLRSAHPPPEVAREAAASLEHTDDDRETIAPGDRVLLVVEDDQPFARIVAETARQRGLKVVIASDGASGIQLARKFTPAAIALDLRLPDVEGWLVLDRLKHDAATRHIPIAIFSADEQEHRALRLGAACFVQKPTPLAQVELTLAELLRIGGGSPRRLLLVEDNDAEREAIAELVGGEGVQITAVSSGKAALEALEGQPFQCLVTDLGLPDMSGFTLLAAIQARLDSRTPPTIVYTGRELTEPEETELRRLTDVIIVKDVRSPERLLYETSLRLHRESSQLSPSQQKLISELDQASLDLGGAKILVVDDDVRNIFAMTSALESHGGNVIYAENGRDGLALLEKNPDVKAVLMDIMMPEMDGYEVMRRIREEPRHRGLPVIAVTAKAMRTDREKCIQAGASDYIAKPVDLEHLLSLLRIWVAS
ncbi:MAG TPA: response regulator, partial [Polyangiaceae bacterium]